MDRRSFLSAIFVIPFLGMRRPSKRAPAKKSPGPPPIPSQGAERGVSVDQASHAALLQRRLWVVTQFRRGMTLERMIEAAPYARPLPLDEEDVRTLYREVRSKTQARLAEEIEFARMEQGERLRARMSEILAGEPLLYQGRPVTAADGTPLRRVNMGAYMAVEREYSAIFGTHAPTKIRLDLGEGSKEIGQHLANAIVGMSDEHRQRLLDEARAARRDADELRRLRLVK